ncbi:hypothetical protein D3C84_1262290 [compost metagenome]
MSANDVYVVATFVAAVALPLTLLINKVKQGAAQKATKPPVEQQQERAHIAAKPLASQK